MEGLSCCKVCNELGVSTTSRVRLLKREVFHVSLGALAIAKKAGVSTSRTCQTEWSFGKHPERCLVDYADKFLAIHLQHETSRNFLVILYNKIPQKLIAVSYNFP